MNIDSFYTYLEHPELLNQQTLEELNEINKRYPYFQASRILYLKNLHLLNDYRYADELKKVSIYAPSRQALYNLIHDDKIMEGNSPKHLEEMKVEDQEIVEEIAEIKAQETDALEIEEETEVAESQIPDEKPEQIQEEPIQDEIIQQVNEETQVIQETEPVIEAIEENKVPEVIPEIQTESEEVKEELIVEPVSVVVAEEMIQEPEIPEEKIVDEPVIDLPVVEEIKAEPEEIKIEANAIIEKKEEIVPKAEENKVESIADIILRKVAEIKESRKEPFKEYVYPVVEKKAEEKAVPVKEEIIVEEKIVSETEKQVEVNEQTEPEISPVVEKLNFEITENIPEIVAPISGDFVPELEKVVVDNIEEEEPEVQEELVQKVTVIEVIENEPEIPHEEPLVLSDLKLIELDETAQFEEIPQREKPVFNLPVYDVSLLLNEMADDYEEEVPEEIDSKSMSFSDWLNYMSNEKKPKKNKAKLPSLIDDFLEKQPKISIQNNTTNPQKSENQELENDVYISEPLADILSSQGHFDQAIAMYEKLALKYPEKFSYFADRILELKNRNSNQ